MEVIQSPCLILAIAFSFIGSAWMIRFTSFAGKVRKSNIRARYKGVGYVTAAIRITLASVFLVIGCTFATMYILGELVLSFHHMAM